MNGDHIMAGPQFEWTEYDVSLSPPLARHMRAFIKARPAARKLGMAAEPVRTTIPLPDLTAFPAPRDKAQILLESAAEEAVADLRPSNDLHGSPDYRRKVARAYVRRALSLAVERAGGGSR